MSGYELGELIGRGGMGVVYRATDVKLDRAVALKLIVPELAGDERFRKRFLDESRLAASLDHASVVPIYEAGEQDGQLFLAMRYVEGSDLRTLLRREGSLALERTLALLGQIAGALDAAHRSGLVHRDVKPANILLDDDDHAYLTDFGVSKQIGGVTTDTGRLVGSLDYLAPEQIAGERVGAGSDQYALACVLYECLTGTPAFRRETEAETLWAHMKGEHVSIPGLERVLKRAFSRDPKDRYGSCCELIAAARVRTRVRHRARWIGAALAALAAAVAAALYLGDGDVEALPPGSFVVALDSDGGIGSFTDATSAPSNIAVGEGAVWVLDSEAETVARLDPATQAVKRFSAGPRPTDLAAGGGAVWVGNGAGSESFQTRVTTSISRVDPGSLNVTGTVELSRKQSTYGPPPSMGFPQMAVGAGALWAVGADNRIYRIDPATGRIVAKIPVTAGVSTLAAGAEGVWFLNWSDHDVRRIDPATNRVADRIPVDRSVAGVAVGGGAVWVTSPDDGRLWRIEPGRRPRKRPIDVGGLPTFVGYGDGAAWTGDYRDGVLARVDARTNAVSRRVRIEAAQALAVGAGSAWVSVAGGTRAGTLPPAACTPVDSGGATPDVLIASDLPLQGGEADITRGLADAIRWVLKDHGFRAGRHVVGYQSCDESTAQTGNYETRRCAANANAFARTGQLVAVIGPFSSFCAQLQIPILNRAPGGPLALVSPSNTAPSLTRGGPIVPAGIVALDSYYPTGTRNYARVIGRDDVEGVALALLARRLRLARVYLLDPSDHEALLGQLAGPFRRAAARLGVGIAGSEDFGIDAHEYAGLAARVARARVDGVVIGGGDGAGGPLVEALRARLGPRVAIMVGDQVYVPGLIDSAGRAAQGVYLATTESLPDAGSLTPAGTRFVARFGTAAHRGNAMNAAAAAEVVLQAIARSDGTRASVLRSLGSLQVTDGILGSFTFDRGDISPARVTVLRVTGATPKNVRLPINLEGANVERVIDVPASLSG